ncbi:hypothetical protein M0R45_035166 [Rubus argutus]|uniref:Uncharacterized protein n=1 Tax=Rubus argutus TaxID=59490 RepID=A0AAW1VXN4_RUBAR
MEKIGGGDGLMTDPFSHGSLIFFTGERKSSPVEGKQRIEARPWRCGGVVGLVEAAWILKRLTGGVCWGLDVSSGFDSEEEASWAWHGVGNAGLTQRSLEARAICGGSTATPLGRDAGREEVRARSR